MSMERIGEATSNARNAMSEPQRWLIGWREWIDLPQWNLFRVRAKIDTGARTSTLGVQHCQIETDPQGQRQARVVLALYRRQPQRLAEVTVPILRLTRVRNSSGRTEERPVVEVLLQLGPICYWVPMTLANRSAMLCPVLLGRQALQGRFVVDVTQRSALKRPRLIQSEIDPLSLRGGEGNSNAR